MSSPALLGLLLSDDMIFTSRIVGTANTLGLPFRVAKNQAALQEQVQEHLPGGIIVDLANPGLDIATLVDWLKQNCHPPPRVVAYGSHVDTATLKRARDAGCDLVLPRSKFVEELPRALPEWLGTQVPERDR
jgi:CheY-like chemotaxis protein